MGVTLPTVRHFRCMDACQKPGASCAARCERARQTMLDFLTEHRWFRALCRLPEPRLTRKEEERLQRLRDYAYQLQNRIDERPVNYNMDRTRARLAALCWAIEKIGGKPFHPTAPAGAASDFSTTRR